MNMAWLGFLVIGIGTAWLARRVLNDAGYGIVWDIVIGIVGALLGGILFSRASVATGESLLGSLIVAALGAIAAVFGMRLIRKM